MSEFWYLEVSYKGHLVFDDCFDFIDEAVNRARELLSTHIGYSAAIYDDSGRKIQIYI